MRGTQDNYLDNFQIEIASEYKVHGYKEVT